MKIFIFPLEVKSKVFLEFDSCRIHDIDNPNKDDFEPGNVDYFSGIIFFLNHEMFCWKFFIKSLGSQLKECQYAALEGDVKLVR